MDPEAVGVPIAPPTSAPASGPVAERGHSLTARASLTAVASLLDYAARLGVGFVVTPILVSGLGRSLFGVWEILGQLVGGYMSASDGRPTEALRLMISSHQATEDAAARRRWVGGALVVWLVLTGITTGMTSPQNFAIPQVFAGPFAAGRWVGMQNFAANLAGISGPVITGLIIDKTGGSYSSAFLLAGAITLASAAFWGIVVPRVEPVRWKATA